MIRKTLTIFSLIGLLLSVASWATPWHIQYKFNHVIFRWSDGGFGVMTSYLSSASTRRQGWGIWGRTYKISWLPQFAPIRIWRNPKLSWSRCLYFTISNWWLPSWMPFVICGVIFYRCDPLRYSRRRKREKLGLCIQCGYNLHGLTEPRCPECGQPFEPRGDAQ